MEEDLKDLVCEEKRGFEVVLDGLGINEYWIDWCEVMEKKDLCKGVGLFLWKFVLFLCK